MTAPAPAPAPPACVRCGAFSPGGPAADLGIPLCASCLDWKPAAPESRVRVAWLVAGIALAPILLAATFALVLPRVGDVDALIALVEGFIILSVAVGAGVAVAGVSFIVWYVRWPARTASRLGIDLERLRAGSGESAVLVPVIGFEVAGERAHAARRHEIAFLVANRRGLVVYGHALRAAAPWRAVSLARSSLPAGWARIAVEGRPASTREFHAVEHAGVVRADGRGAAAEPPGGRRPPPTEGGSPASLFVYDGRGWGAIFPPAGGKRLFAALEPLRAAAPGGPP